MWRYTKSVRRALTVALLAFVPVLIHAQGGSISGQVIQPAPPTGSGGPAPLATVRICTAIASGTPCSPLIPGVPSGSGVFLDPGLTIGTTNPATTDLWGNYALWVEPGPVLVQITPVNGITYSLLVEAVAGTLTSVGLTMPSTVFSVSGSPLTGTGGTIGVTFASQSPNLVFASPPGGPGLPTFRQLQGTEFASQSADTVFGVCSFSPSVPTFCALVPAQIPSTLNGTTFAGNVQVNGTLGVLSAASLSSTLTATGSISTSIGYQIGGTAPVNHVLLGNGTNYIDSATIPYSIITGGPSTAFYQTVASNGSGQTQRPTLNFNLYFSTTDSSFPAETTIAPVTTGTESKLVTAATAGTSGHLVLWDSAGGINDGGAPPTGLTQWSTVSSGCTASGSPCTVSGTWPMAFADATYTMVCSPTSEASSSSAVYWVNPTTSSTFTISIDNRGMSNPGGFGGFYCIGHHI